MTTAIYLRVSQDRAGNELGVDRQRDGCMTVVRQRGWEPVVEYLDNDVSASKGRPRPGYKQLMADVDAGRVTRIVVWQSSRIWRNRKERADGIERLAAVNGSIVQVKGPELNLSHAYGRLMADLMGGFDTAETAIHAERAVAEAKQRAERGLFHGGPKPYGYGPDGMTVIEAEADDIRRWVADLLTGKSITSLARETGRPIAVLRRIVLNPRIAGLRVLKGVEYPGKWPAIVDATDWRALMALLNDPSRRRAADHTRRRWLGAGLYGCERCNGRPVKSAQNSAGAGRGHYPAYRCLAADGGCGRSWKAAPLDEWVTNMVATRLARPDLADLMPATRPDMKPLHEEATEIRRRLNKLATVYAMGTMTDAEMEAATTPARDRLAEIDRATAVNPEEDELRAILGHHNPAAAWAAIPPDDIAARQVIVRGLMTITLGAPPRGRTPFNPKSFVGRSRWVGDTRTWDEIWAEADAATASIVLFGPDGR